MHLCSFASSFAIIQPAAELKKIARKEVKESGEAPKREGLLFYSLKLCVINIQTSTWVCFYVRSVCFFLLLQQQQQFFLVAIIFTCWLTENIFSWHHSHCNFSSLNTHWKAAAAVCTLFASLLTAFSWHLSLFLSPLQISAWVEISTSSTATALTVVNFFVQFYFQLLFSAVFSEKIGLQFRRTWTIDSTFLIPLSSKSLIC